VQGAGIQCSSGGGKAVKILNKEFLIQKKIRNNVLRLASLILVLYFDLQRSTMGYSSATAAQQPYRNLNFEENHKFRIQK